MSGKQLTLTVEELNEYVRRTLAGDPILHGLRLRGEISNFKRHISGHWYFTLKDSQSAINCAMFRTATGSVHFTPRDGLQVVLNGNVGLYVKTGAYQFYADAMEQDGVGELFLRMEALKAKLAKEGLFDAALKKPLPLLPKGIGIVTSATGAVIHDIARIAWRRFEGMPLYLYPVAVQGEGAARQIADAIRGLDQLDAVDVVIVGRGGGSMEDLWAFNEEEVARAIAACRKPVVSAVGHETDFSIADFVADVRAATPSAAAELAVPEREALRGECVKLMNRMRRAGEATVAAKSAALADVRERLAAQAPETRMQATDARVNYLLQRLNAQYNATLTAKKHLVTELSLRLRAASPSVTLNRGYAMVLQGGKPVQSIQALQTDQAFNVVFRDGEIQAKALPAVKEETP